MRYTPPSTLRQICAMFAACLLIITALPLYPAGTARAFMPTNSAAGSAGAGGSSTHESITFDVIKDYDKDLFQLGSKDLTENMKKAQKEIIDANADVDSVTGAQFTQSASHFDGENLQGGQQRLIDYKLKVKELMLNKKPDVSKARWYLGQALHTLQDFYAHSNWVESGNGSPYGVLGVPGNPLTNPPATTKTCTDCARNTCTDCYNPATGLTNLTTTALTTGYYGGDDRAKPNDFKCSHGGKVTFLGGLISSKDSSSKGTIGSGINKDTRNCTISPHNDQHNAAAGVAKQATKKYFDEIKELIKVPKMKLLLGGGNTLAMSIDTTGSMGDIIDQVKGQAIQIVDSRIGTDEEATKYVLAPFNDPDVGPVTVTDDPDEFKSAISALTADGGGDCPELAMTGMLQALDNMDEDGGELMMFTDASAKDEGLAGTVDSVALSKNIKVSPMSFGSCSPIDPGFIRLANDTGGQIFVLARNEAGAITRLADFVIRSNVVDLQYISSVLTGTPQTYDVPVDSTVTRVTFSVSGTPDVVVTRPDNSVVQPTDPDLGTVALTSGAIFSIDGPAAGTWHVRVNGTGDFSLRAIGESPLDFSFFNFVELQGRPSHQGHFRVPGFPQANQTGTILAQVSAKANTANFELRNPDGSTLQPLSLTELGWANNDASESSFTVGPVRQFLGDISTPGGSFRAYVTGVDATGIPYQRVRSGITKPQNVTITPPPSADLTPGQSTTYIFKVTNFGPPDTFSLTGADDNNYLGSISPATVTLGTNESADVSVVLQPPSDAGGNALDTLTVTVQSTGASDAYNYARVKSVVKSTSTLIFSEVTVTEMGGNGNGIIETGEGGSVSAQLVNVGDNNATGISVALTTSTPGVRIATASSAYPDIVPAGIGVNLTPLTFSLDSSVLCGQVVHLTLTVTQTGSTSPIVLDLPVQVGQLAGQPDAPQTFSYTGPAVAIPDNDPVGVNVPLTVSGFTGAVADLNFSFDGTSCTDAAGATTVGLDHTFVGDLVVTLTSPQGKTVTLINRPGGGNDYGNNFCNTLLDDESSGPSIQDIVPANAPNTGTFRPASPLAAFKGENPNGTWVLNVSDRAAIDTGNVRAFSLVISGAKCNTVTAPKADLSVTQTATPDPVVTGSNLTYTVTVTNNGPSTAQNVVVTDSLPGATTFVSCGATDGGICDGTVNDRTVTFPSLAAGASETIGLIVTVNCPVANGAAITNTVTAASSTPDPDPNNNAATVTVTASNPAPVISGLSVDKSSLWPPNHKMVDVTVNYTVTDNCGPLTTALSVASNEPVNGTGDGNTSPDWQVVDAHHVRLRAERSGNGSGRIYTITVTSTDSAGYSSSQTVTVQVPH